MEWNGYSPPVINIHPPLLNSANPWATTLENLEGLFACPSIGAVTVRTSLLKGFDHDPAIHQYTFFDPGSHVASADLSSPSSTDIASLNNLGYSPIPLGTTLCHIKTISDGLSKSSTKPFIISVTGTPSEVAQSYLLIAQHSKDVRMPLAMEINLSCPNIPNAPPPAYSGESLNRYLAKIQQTIHESRLPRIPYGLKTPPYTHEGQFETLVAALQATGYPCDVSFLTATNTLGSCLVLSDTEGQPQLAGSGIGGMAGAPLHPLALGNVATLRRLLDRTEETSRVDIIGVGGVEDAAGYRRMRAVGAKAVGVGTALGRKGLGVFEEIETELAGAW
ncbi:uncharacterized protein BCR38DRAFT_457334 [Pseudomassariella vexata]|uniref:Dihydroorotate dehydrogenase (fumarate) n=1 Tax=Pseudomassariella vexata TaxID=1141098 RepID=A0A1Y2E0L1_9PEZI|nr:uncharacterized protein BCR38DRAFT_457334 [Pseudomassariella vexata]ORY65078.1 hypothetical protein BCR38DRAFT_457334 [Pseudomassariella vexata]